MVALVTGGRGRLGRELVRLLDDAQAPSHAELDITDEDAVRRFVCRHKPDIVFHTAALADIRRCETDRALAWRVNVKGTEHLVRACHEQVKDCRFVYVSTACVFAGDRGNYVETDLPQPKNYYALTKLLGEFVVGHLGWPQSLVVRTNFVARERWSYPTAFTDRQGTYLFADDVALALVRLAKRGVTGLVHVCGDRRLSMYAVARMTSKDVRPMTMEDYHGPPLTMDMTLRSIRIPSFRINFSRGKP